MEKREREIKHERENVHEGTGGRESEDRRLSLGKERVTEREC